MPATAMGKQAARNLLKKINPRRCELIKKKSDSWPACDSLTPQEEYELAELQLQASQLADIISPVDNSLINALWGKVFGMYSTETPQQFKKAIDEAEKGDDQAQRLLRTHIAALTSTMKDSLLISISRLILEEKEKSPPAA